MKTIRSWLVIGLALASIAITAIGCEKEGPMERAGEKVDEAIEEAGDKVEKATD